MSRRRAFGVPGPRLGEERRRRPVAEVLESRRLLSLNLGSEPAIGAFAGVGFARNPVATINGVFNGVPDNNPGDYQAQINWGDSSGSDGSAQLVAVGNSVLVKGT